MPFVSAADAGNDLVVQQPFCLTLGDMTELAKLLQTDEPVNKYEPIDFFSRMVKKSVIFDLPRGKFRGFLFFQDLRNEIP